MKGNLLLIVTGLMLLFFPNTNFGQAPDLGAASSFALFTSAGALNNLGPTIINGDVGTNTGPLTGFPPGTVNGTIHVVDAVSAQAATDLGIAAGFLAGLNCGAVLGVGMGNGQILTPNIYCTGAATTLNGNLTLDALGDPDAIFIFQIDGAFATGVAANVLLINGASSCNVYWQVTGAFDLEDNSNFVGTLVGGGAINLALGATIDGRALTTAGAISTSANFISLSPCCDNPILPTITCAADVSVSCANLVPPVDITLVVTTGLGPITVVFVGEVILNQICLNQFILVRTYMATDICGNEVTCEQTITVNDQTPPTFTFCPPGENLGCNPQSVPPPGPATATDNCGGAVTVTSSLGPITGNPCNRSQTRTYTAADECGNESTCEQIFTWSEVTTSPVFTFCPPGDDLGCNPAGVPPPGNAMATDACGAATITSSLGIITNNGCERSQTRTYTALSACGMSAFCLQIFTWTEDLDAPVFTFCPPGANLGCNPQGVPPPGNATATDACGAVTITNSLGLITGNPCNRSQTRTYTAVDICGNAEVCLQIFTWSEVATSPVFTFCPPGDDLGCNPNGVPPPGNATATDACGAATITSSLGIITNNGCERSQTRTYVAVSACGMSAFCLQIFTWTEDLDAPVFTFCPPGMNLGCNPAGVPPPGNATATDNCGTVTITSSLGLITGNPCNRSQTRTYTAVDICGNASVCLQIFTWSEVATSPVFTFCPPGQDLGCNPNGVPPPGNATATDACGAAVITSSLGIITNNGCQRSQTRTYVALSACGMSAFCLQIFTWTEDLDAPVFTFCPPGMNLGCNPNGVPPPGAAIATDACGTVTITSSLGLISGTPCNRSQTRTYTAVDICGNIEICLQIFTWSEVASAPIFTFCPPGMDLGCNPAGIPPPGNATATDACGAVTITNSLGIIINNGCQRTQIRTYTAISSCGTPAVCLQIFTWTEDLAAPIFTFCPPGADLGCNPTGVPAPGNATATDACGNVTITSALGAVIVVNICSRSQTRIYTATDVCGNQSFCNQIFTWTVGATSPTFTFCPPGADLGCNPAGVPPPGNATATDICGTPIITSSLGIITNNGCQRSQTRTYTAVNACGNSSVCLQIFTWTVDLAAPIFTFCPPGADLGCNPAGIPAPGNATATDVCGTPIIVSNLGIVVINGCQRTQTRIYTATDACGNQSFCNQIFTWTVDLAPPVFTFCPPGADLGCNPNGIPLPGNALATDACGAVTMTNSLGNVLVNGCQRSQIRTYTATDACGNLSICNQIFTWTVDLIAPTIICPQPVVVGCASDLPSQNIGNVVVSDACGNVVVTFLGQVVSNQTCANRFTLTRNYRATDACGNSADCAQIITVNDVTPPLFFENPENVTVECSPTNEAQYLAWLINFGGAQATDCSTITWSIDTLLTFPIDENCGGNFAFNIRFTATDACGNASFRDAFFITVDNTPPVFTVLPGNFVMECMLDCDGITELLGWLDFDAGAVVTDNCSEVELKVYIIDFVEGCGASYVKTYRFEATDACGNTTTATATFSFIDTEPPTVICPPDEMTLLCAEDLPLPDLSSVIASDGCGSATVSLVKITGDDTGCNGWTYTYLIVDECGLTAECVQSFGLNPETVPVSYFPDTIFVACVDDLPNEITVQSIFKSMSMDVPCAFNCFIIMWDSGVLQNGVPQNGVTWRTFTIVAKNICLKMTAPFNITFATKGICKPICTTSENVWGDPNGQIDTIAVAVALANILEINNGVTVGKFIRTISTKSSDCVLSMLPGVGGTGELSVGNFTATPANNCNSANGHSNPDGSMNNTIASATMALQLNIWYNQIYNNRDLGIQKFGDMMPCLVPGTVFSRLSDEPTVQELLNLSNDYLASVGFFEPSFGSELKNTLAKVNDFWKNCTTTDPCTKPSKRRDAEPTVLGKFELVPNPTSNSSVLTFSSEIDGEATMKLIAADGKMTKWSATIFKGNNTLTVNLENLPAGVYSLALQIGSEQKILRLVKIVN